MHVHIRIRHFIGFFSPLCPFRASTFGTALGLFRTIASIWTSFCPFRALRALRTFRTFRSFGGGSFVWLIRIISFFRRHVFASWRRTGRRVCYYLVSDFFEIPLRAEPRPSSLIGSVLGENWINVWKTADCVNKKN